MRLLERSAIVASEIGGIDHGDDLARTYEAPAIQKRIGGYDASLHRSPKLPRRQAERLGRGLDRDELPGKLTLRVVHFLSPDSAERAGDAQSSLHCGGEPEPYPGS